MVVVEKRMDSSLVQQEGVALEQTLNSVQKREVDDGNSVLIPPQSLQTEVQGLRVAPRKMVACFSVILY